MEMIICPHCNKEVELSAAIFHELREKVSKELSARQKEELTKIRTETEEKVRKEVEKNLDFQLKNQAKENEELKTKNDKLYAELLELNKNMRELKDQERNMRLENEKKLNETLEKFQGEFEQKAKMERLELEKKLTDTQKALEDAQRASKQGSQQLQGEVLELDLETKLRNNFSHDEVTPVPKGFTGGDIWQKVKNSRGQTAGTILWETKRAKSWDGKWSGKLREDARAANASLAVLITDVLPATIEHFGIFEGIWVANYSYALALAGVLRASLIQIAAAKSAASHKDEELREIYEQQQDLEAEKRSQIRVWKRREGQINRMMVSTSTMYGELQGRLGNALPSIKSLEAPEDVEQEDLFGEILKEA
jgi:hypothetical protein